VNIHPVTYQTTRLLVMGYQPRVLARLDGVQVNTIHVRRLRFERATGGESTGRFGKRGRPRKIDPKQGLLWPA
jgi:hypothetical protein